MTCFMLFDEFERDFESLEEHPARHAAAVAMFCLVGQKCAQRMTDGVIPPGIIPKTFAAWPKAMASAATADLIALGMWQQNDDGQLCFVDWDLRQFTRDRELARREKHASRQRRYATKKKNEQSDSLTRQLTSQVTKQLVSQLTAPSPSPSDPDQRSSLRDDYCAPHSDRHCDGESNVDAKQRARDERWPAFVALETALKMEMERRGEELPHVYPSLLRGAAHRVAEHSKANGCSLKTSARLLATSWADEGSELHRLSDVRFSSDDSEAPF